LSRLLRCWGSEAELYRKIIISCNTGYLIYATDKFSTKEKNELNKLIKKFLYRNEFNHLTAPEIIWEHSGLFYNQAYEDRLYELYKNTFFPIFINSETKKTLIKIQKTLARVGGYSERAIELLNKQALGLPPILIKILGKEFTWEKTITELLEGDFKYVSPERIFKISPKNLIAVMADRISPALMRKIALNSIKAEHCFDFAASPERSELMARFERGEDIKDDAEKIYDKHRGRYKYMDEFYNLDKDMKDLANGAYKYIIMNMDTDVFVRMMRPIISLQREL